MFTLDKPDNLVEMFEASAQRFGSNLWMGTKNSAKDGYDWVTYEQASRRIAHLRGGLAQLGIQKGDAVGIIANNRVAWAVACYATYSLAARYVPMYEAELEKTWRYIVEDAAIRILFVSKPEIFNQGEKLARRDRDPGSRRSHRRTGGGHHGRIGTCRPG